MLYVLFSEVENIKGVYSNVNLDFAMLLEANWFEDGFVKRIIKA